MKIIDAVRKVAALQPGLAIVHISEYHDSWIITTGFSHPLKGQQPPGNPVFVVDKETGESHYLDVGSDEFFKIIGNTQEVILKEVTLPYQAPGGEHAS